MNKRLTTSLITVCSACIILLLPPAPAHGQLRVGVVDILKTLNDSSIGQRAKHRLTELIQSRQEIMDKKEKEIEELKANLAMLPDLSGELRERREAELGRLIEEYTVAARRLQGEIEDEQEGLTRQVTESLKRLVEEIGRIEDYSLIIDRDEDFVLYCDKSLLLEIK